MTTQYSHLYAVGSLSAELAAASMTWSSGYTTNRARINDGLVDQITYGSSTPQASGQTLTFDFGVSTQPGGVAILNHNLGVGACSVNIQYYDGTWHDAMDVSSVTVNTVAPNNKDSFFFLNNADAGDQWRIVFNHTGTKTISLGEVFFTASNTTSVTEVLNRRITYGSGLSERFIVNRVESSTGHLRSTYLAGPIQTMNFSFKDLSESDRKEVMDMWRATYGGAKNILFVEKCYTGLALTTTEKTDMQVCIFGKMQEELGWTQDDYSLYGVTGMTIIGQGKGVGT